MSTITAPPVSIVFGEEHGDVLIRDERERLHAIMWEPPEDKIPRCRCCDRKVRGYRRALNSGMARSLVWLARWSRMQPGEYVHVPTQAPRFVLRSREFDKLEHWALIVRKENEDETKRESGEWAITERGVSFVNHKLIVPSHVLMYNNEVLGTDGETDIVMSLGEHFNYQALMSAHNITDEDKKPRKKK